MKYEKASAKMSSVQDQSTRKNGNCNYALSNAPFPTERRQRRHNGKQNFNKNDVQNLREPDTRYEEMKTLWHLEFAEFKLQRINIESCTPGDRLSEVRQEVL